MRTLHDVAHPDRRAKILVIMLPGALQKPEDFVQAGFIDALRKRGLSIDLTLVDLGIDYIGESTGAPILQRIDIELMQPARLQHYDAVWLGGISIGGLIAIAYADRYPARLDGLCLLSPYPGNRILLREIEAAGGLERWHAVTGADQNADTDAERAMWRWLQGRAEQRRTKQARNEQVSDQPRVHLGYGQQDRFAPGMQLISAALATAHADTIPGDHDWPTWHKLWENFLEQTLADLRPDVRKPAE